MKAKRILLADNDPKILSTLAGLLREEGYVVLLARNPEEAESILDAGEIDLAVIDKKLRADSHPGDRSGIELAAREGDQVPKILLTGDNEMRYGEVDDLIARGRLRVVLKQKGPRALLKAIKESLIPTVFLAHGSNKLSRTEVQFCLQQWGLAARVLVEEHDAGIYLLSSLETAADECAAAIILMTADDEASPITKPQEKQARARQNVVFELGYFIGRLGSKHVIALIEDEVEKPSNYDGVKYITFTPHGSWKAPLMEALKHAGVDVNLYMK